MGFTPREARTHEPLAARLARELLDEPEEMPGDWNGDAIDTDGELIDDQVGSIRAGRLTWSEPDSRDPHSDYWATDNGINGQQESEKTRSGASELETS